VNSENMSLPYTNNTNNVQAVAALHYINNCFQPLYTNTSTDLMSISLLFTFFILCITECDNSNDKMKQNKKKKEGKTLHYNHHDGSISNISCICRECLCLWISDGLLNDAHLPWPRYKSFTPARQMIGFCEESFCVETTCNNVLAGSVLS